MNKQKMNIAIAKYTGWVDCHIQSQDGLPDCALGRPYPTSDWRRIPDYCDDRSDIFDAMNELKASHRGSFINNLMEVTGEHPIGCVPDYYSDRLSLFRLVQTLPFELARAYCITIADGLD